MGRGLARSGVPRASTGRAMRCSAHLPGGVGVHIHPSWWPCRPAPASDDTESPTGRTPVTRSARPTRGTFYQRGSRFRAGTRDHRTPARTRWHHHARVTRRPRKGARADQLPERGPTQTLRPPPDMLPDSVPADLDPDERPDYGDGRLDYHTRLTVAATSTLRTAVHTARCPTLPNRHGSRACGPVSAGETGCGCCDRGGGRRGRRPVVDGRAEAVGGAGEGAQGRPACPGDAAGQRTFTRTPSRPSGAGPGGWQCDGACGWLWCRVSGSVALIGLVGSDVRSRRRSGPGAWGPTALPG